VFIVFVVISLSTQSENFWIHPRIARKLLKNMCVHMVVESVVKHFGSNGEILGTTEIY